MHHNELWKLIFVIPIALIMCTMIPLFLAAWISTMLLIFHGFVSLANGSLDLPKENFLLLFKLKEIVKRIKNEGWSLILVRTLGISVFLHGFAIILVLIGIMVFIEEVIL